MTEPDVVQEQTLTLELMQLRRGHGLHSDDVMSRVGPGLRAAAGIGDGDATAPALDKLLAWLSAVMESLPPDLRLAVQAALALQPASQERFLKDRMDWLGVQLQRDPRTATRRVESGFTKIAQRMVRTPGPPRSPGDDAADGWYTESLHATLLFHADPVRLIENRQVVATRPGLDRIPVSWSVPRDPGLPPDAQVSASMVYGGELVPDLESSSPTYWSGSIRLARPLVVGRTHAYQVEVTSLSRAHLRPYYVASPMRRLDEFVLRAKFEAGAMPDQIWVLDGAPYRQVDEQLPTRRLLIPDDVGEVAESFTNLRPGLSYGLQWSR
jgi:hypothetical protein